MRVCHPGSGAGEIAITVSALIVTHDSEAPLVEALLSSLRAQTHPLEEILIVDNGSKNVDSIQKMARTFSARVLALSHNRGFPYAVNVGMRELNSETVLILNDDVTLEPSAVSEMISTMQRHPDCGAVAPKTYLAQFPGFLDSIGIVINERFSAYNRGIGEPDLGQYDVEEKTFGVCFASALLKRDLYLTLGGMDPSYFAYYEDVDYCYRMTRAGFFAYTSPRAVVTHHHSHFWKRKPALRKYFLIQRNLLRTAVKHLKLRALARVLLFRYLEHFNRFLRDPDFRWITVAILGVHILECPYWFLRRFVPPLPRKVTDHDIFRFSYGREPHFNPLDYRPEYTLSNLVQVYTGLYEVTLSQGHLLKAEALKALKERSRTLAPDECRTALTRILEGEPELVRQFADLLEEERPS